MLALRKDGETPSDRQPGRSRATYYILKTVGGPLCPSGAINCIIATLLGSLLGGLLGVVRRAVRLLDLEPAGGLSLGAKRGEGEIKGGISPQSIILLTWKREIWKREILLS